MLRPISDMPPGTIGFEAVGEVEDDDWEEQVEPMLRREMADGRKIRLLYLIGAKSREVEGDAMTADTGFRARYASSFDRVAVVSDESWMRPAMKGLSFLLPGKARAFPVAELAAAKAWLSENADLGAPEMNPGESSAEVGGPSALHGDAAVESDWTAGSRRLAVLLAMAMFVLVVDTSLMNVSIAKVVEDLDTTVSGVQGAIALEALVSAAFILIGSKVGDLIGRKRAFVLGLLGICPRRPRDGARSGPDGDHRLLGDRRRARGLDAAAGDAVADPRQLRGCEHRRRPTRWSGRRRRSPPPWGRCSAAS